ncbi:MAG: serine hydrolase [Pseudomonadota bacterium]
MTKKTKTLLVRVAVFVLVLLLVAAIYFVLSGRYNRLQMASNLFSGAEQYENFNRVYELFPSAEVPASSTPYPFEKSPQIELPQSYEYSGMQQSTEQFLTDTDTSALLVLKDGNIVFEEYWLTGGQDVQWLSMSVAKSVVATLIGIAVEEGAINSIEDPITKYVSQLEGSAYDGVRIKDILQMSSGARWNEDYSDFNSDVNRFGRIFALGGSMNEFVRGLERELDPGSYNRYNSADTQALGMMLVTATGETISEYTRTRLWEPMGAEASTYWLLDNDGMEMAFGGLNATARDYAKIGELYRLGGKVNGLQIVPQSWVRDATTPDAPHLYPGDNENSDNPFGYGYQWWVLEGNQGEYSAIGVYNQFIYVNPSAGTVIVKLSANSDYGVTLEEKSYREHESFELFRAIVATLRKD